MKYCIDCNCLYYESFSTKHHKLHNCVNLNSVYCVNTSLLHKYTTDENVFKFFSLDYSNSLELSLNNKSASDLLIISKLLDISRSGIDNLLHSNLK